MEKRTTGWSPHTTDVLLYARIFVLAEPRRGIRHFFPFEPQGRTLSRGARWKSPTTSKCIDCIALHTAHFFSTVVNVMCAVRMHFYRRILIVPHTVAVESIVVCVLLYDTVTAIRQYTVYAQHCGNVSCFRTTEHVLCRAQHGPIRYYSYTHAAKD